MQPVDRHQVWAIALPSPDAPGSFVQATVGLWSMGREGQVVEQEGVTIMALPKRLSTEYLAHYGFDRVATEPHFARHRQWNSLLTHCARCGHWVIKATENIDRDEWICGACLRLGGKPTLPEPCSKIYLCCGDDSCPRRKVITDVLRQFQTEFSEHCHDGVGGQFIRVQSLPPVNSREKNNLLTALFAMAEPRGKYLKMQPCGRLVIGV